MRKSLHILATAFLVIFCLAGLATAGEDAPPDQPKIFNSDIFIDFQNRTFSISLEYKNVAGGIDKSKIMLVIGTSKGSGEVEYYTVNLNFLDSKKKGEEGKITPKTMTQGRKFIEGFLLDDMKIEDPKDVTGVGLVIIDCLGRKAGFFLPAPDNPESKREI